MHRYFEVDHTGPLSALRLKEQDQLPAIGNGQLLIEVKAIGINYADIFAIMGLYSATPKVPFIPGLEFSGVVVLGEVKGFRLGQRVMGVTRFGGYSSHIVADPDYLVPLPNSWTFEQGAAFPVQTLTAYYALKTLGDLQPEQTILIHSAAGGVGLIANRIAKMFGAYTIGVVGSGEKIKVLMEEGYDAAIVRGKKFRHDLERALDGRVLDLVLEATGGKYFTMSYSALAPMGRIIAYGSAQFTPAGNRPNYLTLLWKYLLRPKVDPLKMISENKSVMAFNLIWLYERKNLLQKLLKEIDDLKLAPPRIGLTRDFLSLPDALKEMKRGQTTGKVVITVRH